MQARQLPLKLQADGNFRFDRFVGGGNEVLLKQLKNLSGRKLRCAEQLYLHGPAASGKTHLLQAACRQASECGHSSAYLPLSTLAERGARRLQGLDRVAFIALDNCDAVLSDDSWQEALFALINMARDRRHCLLMAGHASPLTMRLALRDLQSRLVWGGVYAVNPLSDADKSVVLAERAATAGYHFSDEALSYLFKNCPRDLSSLIALLRKLLNSGYLRNRTITVPSLKRLLGDKQKKRSCASQEFLSFRAVAAKRRPNCQHSFFSSSLRGRSPRSPARWLGPYGVPPVCVFSNASSL